MRIYLFEYAELAKNVFMECFACFTVLFVFIFEQNIFVTWMMHSEDNVDLCVTQAPNHYFQFNLGCSRAFASTW